MNMLRTWYIRRCGQRGATAPGTMGANCMGPGISGAATPPARVHAASVGLRKARVLGPIPLRSVDAGLDAFWMLI